MGVRARHGKAAGQTGEGRRSPTRAATTLKELRDAYGLSECAFARLLGLPAALLTRWEAGEGRPDSAQLARAREVRTVLHGLARVMRKEFIPTWLESPNDACKELGARTPLDLMERGNHAAVEQMIYFLEAGEPF